MVIAVGADHGGYLLKETIVSYLKKGGFDVIDVGTNSSEAVDYPIYGRKVGELVASQEAEYGIIVCGTGIGISIAANKVPGVRAALCTNTTMARLCREHNNANILALGARIVGEALALDIVRTFLKGEFQGGRHARRVDMIEK